MVRGRSLPEEEDTYSDLSIKPSSTVGIRLKDQFLVRRQAKVNNDKGIGYFYTEEGHLGQQSRLTPIMITSPQLNTPSHVPVISLIITRRQPRIEMDES